MKKLLLTSLLALPFLSFSQASLGEVMGTIVLKKDKSAAFGAKIQTESNGTIYRAIADSYGRFRISAIPAGKYSFSVIFEGDTLNTLTASVPIEGILNVGTIEFVPKTVELGPTTVTLRIMPNLMYGVSSEVKMDLDQIKHSPQKFDQKAMIASMSSEIKVADDGELMFRGGRKGDMIYMMDGVKMTHVANVPSASIGGLMVYTGGIPAKYGDTMGGVVVMESLSYFDLYRNWVSSELRKNK